MSSEAFCNLFLNMSTNDRCPRGHLLLNLKIVHTHCGHMNNKIFSSNPSILSLGSQWIQGVNLRLNWPLEITITIDTLERFCNISPQKCKNLIKYSQRCVSEEYQCLVCHVQFNSIILTHEKSPVRNTLNHMILWWF